MNTQERKHHPYHEYYIGEKDDKLRRRGFGENHWTGAESIEWYTGDFTRNTMHGNGDYRWRYRSERNAFVTYEGYFYGNCMHGYGVMSYPDGWVFDGLFFNNIRWGPGIESQACQREDVGLWRGQQLVRLSWQPPVPVTLDLLVTKNGRACVAPHRKILTTSTKTIGKINSAIELLKQCGSEPKSAADNWTKLYPKNCNDLKSQLCHVEVFERDYYKGKIQTLEEIDNIFEITEEDSQGDSESISPTSYYAWNNNNIMVHMMKHCFKHEMQRTQSRIDLMTILTGHRNAFKPPGKHELDCRTLLMASFLGDIINVAQLINECDVYPDVADMHGNTALMYAACGNQAEVIHFLVEAGANVDSYNDSCCTALGVALISFACARRVIPFRSMTEAVLPPPIIPTPPSVEEKVIEWNISHDLPVQVLSPVSTIKRATSKTIKVASVKSLKNLKSNTAVSLKDVSEQRDKPDTMHRKLTEIIDFDFCDPYYEESKLYSRIDNEYSIIVDDMFLAPVMTNPVPYLFKVNDMIDKSNQDEEQKKVAEKNPKKMPSKVLKNNTKVSKEMMWQSPDKDGESIDSVEKKKLDLCARIMSNIRQLLADGASPKLVRCPQPALFIATASGCPDLIRCLVNYGADVNEVLPQTFGYSILDIAVSYSFTNENLELIRTLLQCRANPDHRLPYDSSDSSAPEILGPTLLHTVLHRKTENDEEEEIQRQVLKLLLEYNCNPITQFNGRSALDIAIYKSFDILEIFIRNPGTNLNAVINDTNQTVLIKMFTLAFCKTIAAIERLQTLTNLLLFGANPLLECQDGEVIYKNVFVFAKRILKDLETQNKTNSSLGGSKTDSKGKGNEKPKVEKKVDKSKKDEKLPPKSVAKVTDDLGDYKQAIELTTECGRLLHIRWLQAKLLKELAHIVYKYKHRHWNMILKEHKNQRSAGLWLTTPRCLEIWDILRTTNRKIYDDKRVLKHLLCIVQFYDTRLKKTNFGLSFYLTAEEKRNVEMDVDYILREHKLVAKLPTEMASWKKMYVMPELKVKADKEFNVCFECALPFEDEVILCSSCKLVSFCSSDCMRNNMDRVNCHPCSKYLRHQFFPTSSENSIMLEVRT